MSFPVTAPCALGSVRKQNLKPKELEGQKKKLKRKERFVFLELKKQRVVQKGSTSETEISFEWNHSEGLNPLAQILGASLPGSFGRKS